MGWTGGQTLIARISAGDAEYIGRFSSVARIGTTLAPVIAGFLYDVGGPFLAYGFGFLWAQLCFLMKPVSGEDGQKPSGNYLGNVQLVRKEGNFRFQFQTCLHG